MGNDTSSKWISKAAIFLSSQTISLFGSSIVAYAIIWYITLETSSGNVMTITILCTFLPQIVISLFAGVWADRYSRKKMIIYSDLFISLSTLALAAFFMAGMTSLNLIYFASIVRSIGSGIQGPAVGAILPQIVPVEKLTRINGINSTVSSVMQIMAPAVGGLLLATVGFVYALFFDVVTGVVAVIIMSFLKVDKVTGSDEPVSTIEGLKRGVKYAREHVLIKYLLLFSCIFFFLVTPAAFLTPLLVERSFGSDIWRLAANELAWTIGALLGGIAVALKGEIKNRINAMAVSCFAFGITYAFLGIVPGFFLYLIVMLLSGIFMPIFNTAATVMIQENVAEEMLGRVFSIIQIIISVVMPLGMIVFGPLADVIRIEYMMIGTGLLLAILAIYIFSNKSILMYAQDKSGEQNQ
jgi:MFS transporter, DHA3 family, macrolide efflux protein